MTSINHDTIFKLVVGDEEKRYVINKNLRMSLETLINEMDDIDFEKKVRMIKGVLSTKFNLKISVYKEDKILNNMLYEFFDEKEVKKILTAGQKIRQKRYYENKKLKNTNTNEDERVKFIVNKEIK